MRLSLVSFLLCLFTSINALHFYLDANQKRCFIEELPSDTVVEGTSPNLLQEPGRASNNGLNIFIVGCE